MKMKRFLGIVMMASLLFSLLPAGVSSAENSVEGTDQAVKFTIGQKSYNAGGRLVETDVAPYIKSLADGGGRTMVPVAFVAPALGAETPVWFPGERAVEIRKGQNLIRITIGSKELVVDGKKVQMDVAAEIKDLGTGGGRTMLPIAFVAKALGVGYEWDGAASSVTFFGYTKTYDLEGVYGPASGTQTIEGSVEVKADGVTLQNMVIRGNLTICEEVGAGNVTLNNIVVKGDTFVRGGGKDSIHINGGQYSSFSIQNVDGQVRIVAKDVNGLEVVISENAKGQEIILEGRFDSVVVDAQDVNITTQSQTTIGEVQVGANGTGATITLGQNTVVDKMVLDSQAEVKGSGTVKDAEVNADGVKFDKAPEKQSGTKPVSVSTPPPTTPPASGGGGGGGGGGGNTDTTAPEFAATYPKAGSAQAAGSKQVEILVQVNEAGTAYYVVVANNADAPSAAQVMAGNDSTDGAALDAANAAVVADTEESFVTAALPTDATAYDVYVVVKDGSNNTTAASKVDVTTPAAADVTAPTVTFNPADGAIDVPIAGDITITFSEAVRNLDDSAIQAADLATMLTLKETNAGGADVDFTASINAGRTVITIDPDADLLNGQACYVAIAAAVEDASDNVIAAADATFTTAEALSSDASLTSVAGQTDGTPGAQTGENPVNAITWEINVANAQADLVLADIAVAADATANLYLNADFAAGEIIGADTMPLAVGDTTAYIKVTAQDGSAKHYAVTITRAAAWDETAPEFAATYPKAGAGQAAGSRQVEILVQVNEAGTAYYVVVADGADAPSAAQIMAGNDSTDGAALDAGDAAVAADTEESFVTAALPADNTDYDVYVVVKDGSNNATGATKVDVITPVAAEDVTAPEFAATYPKAGAGQAAGSRQVEILVQVNEAGTAYYVVVADGADTPSAAQVTAGNDSTDGAALDAASAAVAADTEESFVTAALPADNTDYDVYVVVKDGSNNATGATKVDVITPVAAADVTAPEVEGLSPADDAANAAIDANLVVTFSENVDAVGGKNIYIKKSADDSTLATIAATDAQVTVNGSEATVNPDDDLAYNTGYYVQIEAGAFKDESDNDFAGINDTTTWNFTTIAENIPANATSGITMQAQGAAGSKQVTLSVVVQNAAGTGLAGYAAADFSVEVDGAAVTFAEAPFSDFTDLGGGVYTVVFTGAADGTEYNLTALTVDGVVIGAGPTGVMTPEAADVTAPEVEGLSPADDAANAAIDVNLVVTFSENVDAVGGKNIYIKKSADDSTVATIAATDAQVTVNGSEATVNPDDDLAYNTGYYVQIEAGAFKDESDNDFAGINDTTTWNFTTIAENIPADATSGITMQAQGAAGSKQVTLSVVVQNAAGTGLAGYAAADFSVEVDGAAVTFAEAPFSDFTDLGGGVYTVVFTGAADGTEYNLTALTAGGVVIGAGPTGVMTPEAADVTAPEVEGLSPADDAANIAIDANLVVTFSENVDAVGGKNIYIKKSADDSTLATIAATDAQVTVNGSEATVNPDDDLAYNTGYYVQIEAGAFKDESDNDFAGINDTTTWNFTTIAENIPADATSGITMQAQGAAGSKQVTLSVVVQNAAGTGLAGYAAADFSVEVDGAAVTFAGAPFSDFTDLGGGVYTVVFTGAADGTEYNLTALTVDGVVIGAGPTGVMTPEAADVTAPTVTFNPEDGAIDVAIDGDITITFSEVVRNLDNSAVENEDLAAMLTLKETDAGGADVDFTASINPGKTVITIDPDADLSNSQDYYVAIAAAVEDAADNAITAANATFTTAAAADVTAPEFAATYPKGGFGQAAGSKQVEVLVQVNEAGTAYYVVVADGADAPSAAQVMAGNDSTDGAAMAAANAAVIADTERSFVTAALPEDMTDYDVYVVVKDGSDNATAAAKVDVTTPAAPGLPSVELTGLTEDLAADFDHVFEGPIYSYELAAANNEATVNITPTLEGATITWTVDTDAADPTDPMPVNSGEEAAVPLEVGTNLIVIQVEKAGFTTRAYFIYVTRNVPDVQLTGLTEDLAANLNPPFAGGIYNYTLDATSVEGWVNFIPTLAGATITLDVDTDDDPPTDLLQSMPLEPGVNVFTIHVVKAGFAAKDYTITVTQAVANLTGLTENLAANFVPDFESWTYAYTLAAANEEANVDITPTLEGASLITWNVNTDGIPGSTGIDSGETANIPLIVGPNVISIHVEKLGCVMENYTITVTRAALPNVELTALVENLAADFNPAFAGGTYAYTLAAANEEDEVQITPTLAGATITWDVDTDEEAEPTAVGSGAAAAIPLDVGANVVTIHVEQAGTTAKDYVITVTRADVMPDVQLDGLTENLAADLDPGFAGGTYAYTLAAANAEGEVQITPTLAGATITWDVNTDGEAEPTPVNSGEAAEIPLSAGANTVTIHVEKAGTTAKDYVITVTRAEPDVELTSLTEDLAADLDPGFTGGTYAYTLGATNAEAAVNITPTLAGATITWDVDTDGTADPTPVNSGEAAAVPLEVGANVVTVHVEKAGTAAKDYTITVTRAGLSDVELTGLTENLMADLDPGFAGDIYEYTLDAADAEAAVNITPTLAGATITWDVDTDETAEPTLVNSGEAAEIPLVTGANTVTIHVVKAGTVAKDYTITVTRAEPDVELTSLTEDLEADFDPAFAGDVYEYTLAAAGIEATVNIIPTLAGAAITWNVSTDGQDDPTPVNSGEPAAIPLDIWDNVITIHVEKAGAAARDYIITVTREAPPNVELTSLTENLAADFNPAFAGHTYSYVLAAASDEAAVNIIPTLDGATITWNVNTDEVPGPTAVNSGEPAAIPLEVGDNTITIQVEKAGFTTRLYAIYVTRAA